MTMTTKTQSLIPVDKMRVRDNLPKFSGFAAGISALDRERASPYKTPALQGPF